MEPTQVLEAVDTKLSDQKAEINQILADFKQEISPKPDDKTDAVMSKGAMEGITDLKVWDVPVGQAAVGGFVAVIGSELVDGFFANQQPMTLGVIKLASAGILAKWGGRLLGSAGSKAAAIILAYDGIRQILPLDEWAGNLVGAVTARTGGGLAGKAGMTKEKKTPAVIRQAESVVANYYADLSG